MFYKRFKRIICFDICLLCIINVFSANKVSAATDGKKILIIASYNATNEWEQTILNGIRESLNPNDVLNVEYLDTNASKSTEYDDNFLSLLNMKYMDKYISCIIFLDDEAVEFARANLFNEKAFCYKTPMLFAGANQMTVLSDKEKEFISVIMSDKSALNTVNIMIDTLPKLKHIYLLIDDSKYCKEMESDVASMPLFNDGIDVSVLRIVNIETLDTTLSKLNKEDTAILLSGTYSSISNESKLPSKIVIDYLKQHTDVPIYTTLNSYVVAGAIGGIVDSGEKLGEMCIEFVEKTLFKDSSKKGGYLITPQQGDLKTSLFNFKSIREYNINPLYFPPNSVYLNKKFYDILLPEQEVLIVWIILFGIVVIIIFLIILTISNKRKALSEHVKLIESQQREAIKTDYIIIMSHEFRTPLNIIKSITELLIDKIHKGNIDEEYLIDKLNMIMKNSDRLNKTINNSIDVSKIEAGVMNSNFKMYNIVELVEDIVTSSVDYAEKNNVEIVFDTAEEEIYTAVDKKSLDRIILNLLSNAVKNIPGKGSIYVKCEKRDNNTLITIKDTGTGISLEAQHHIFEKFYQARNSASTRSYEGSGLGLYIVKSLIDLLKGHIELNSQLGEGTTFTITIPITIVDEFPSSSDENEDLNYLTKMEFSDL